MILGSRWHSWALFTLIVAGGAGRVAATYSPLSATFDEPLHFACGVEYLSRHVYRYETQHPPLSRAMAAVLPYISGVRTTGEPDMYQEAAALLPPDARSDRILIQMRLGVLPFFFIAAAVVFLWARRCYGPATALVATAIFTLIPPVLAHAGLATTDMALTACLGAAFYCLICWSDAPTWQSAALMGCWTGLAVLSKFSTFVYLPAAAGISLLGFWLLRRPGPAACWKLARSRALTLVFAAVIAGTLMWAAYGFSFGRVPGWRPGKPGVVNAIKAAVRVPAPQLVDGIGSVVYHNARGHETYLMGKRSSAGWWYFFPISLAVKTPIPILALFLIGLFVSRPWRNTSGWLLFAFLAGVLCPAMAGRINIGVRHVLPVYIPIAIFAAAGLMRILRPIANARVAALAAIVVLLCIAIPGIRQHPDYLAYTNAFAGNAPEKVIVGSDLDWGQDMKLLAARLSELGAGRVTVWLGDGAFNDLDRLKKQYGFPPARIARPSVPEEGWTAVSATETKLHPPRPQAWWEDRAPTERVGGMLLYYVAPLSDF